MIQTTVYYDECFQDHVSTLDYPECSDRVKNIIDLINKEDFNNISIVKPNEVEKSLIYSAHSKDFVEETLARFPSNNEIVFLDQGFYY